MSVCSNTACVFRSSASSPCIFLWKSKVPRCRSTWPILWKVLRRKYRTIQQYPPWLQSLIAVKGAEYKIQSDSAKKKKKRIVEHRTRLCTLQCGVACPRCVSLCSFTFWDDPAFLLARQCPFLWPPTFWKRWAGIGSDRRILLSDRTFSRLIWQSTQGHCSCHYQWATRNNWLDARANTTYWNSALIWVSEVWGEKGGVATVPLNFQARSFHPFKMISFAFNLCEAKELNPDCCCRNWSSPHYIIQHIQSVCVCLCLSVCVCVCVVLLLERAANGKTVKK